MPPAELGGDNHRPASDQRTAPQPAYLIGRLLPELSSIFTRDVQLELVGDDRFIDIVEQEFDDWNRLGHFVQSGYGRGAG